MSDQQNGYAAIVELLGEISKAQDAAALVAALTMVYVGIDTMAWLSLPVGHQSHTKVHFINWVNRYLRADENSEYQYVGLEIYAARCALLHNYGAVADLHRRVNPPKTFLYADNGPHRLRPDEPGFVLISIATLIRDFAAAVADFTAAAVADRELKRCIDSRILTLLKFYQVGHQGDLNPQPAGL